MVELCSRHGYGDPGMGECERSRRTVGLGGPGCHRRRPDRAGSGEAIRRAGIGAGSYFALWDNGDPSIPILKRAMKPVAILAFGLLLFQSSLCTKPGVAREVPSATQSQPSPEITFHSSSNLVLVDVIARNAKNDLPDKTLKRDDFQIFDNGHSVSIETFDSGAQFTSRPLAIWFVVQCTCKIGRRGVPVCFEGESVF